MFLLLWVIFALLDPDPDSESGSADPIESGSNPDPDPQPYYLSAKTFDVHLVSEFLLFFATYFFFHSFTAFTALCLKVNKKSKNRRTKQPFSKFCAFLFQNCHLYACTRNRG